MSSAFIERSPSRQYCIKRSNGQIVPLIEADRLPDVPELNGIHRILSSEQAFDWGFVRVDAAQHASLAIPSSPALSAPSNLDGNKQETEDIRRQIGRGQKVWCSKWLDTRDCAFQQQGCRYRHTIPPRELWTLLGFPTGRNWWRQEAPHMCSTNHIQRTLARVRSTSGGRINARPNPLLNAGRPRVPAVPSVASSHSQFVQESTSRPVAMNGETDKCSSSEDVNLIDFDDDLPGQPLSTSSSSDDLQAPAQKKTKLDEEAAQTESASAPTVRPFIPAGEDVQKHVAEARAYAGRYRSRGHQSRNKRKTKPASQS